VNGRGQPRHSAEAQPVKKTRYPMCLLQILQQAQARQRGEAAFAYIHSDEGRAMLVELDRLRADCAEAEANYLATCARCDAERKAEGRA
jgi:hypothetical protein